jgi:DNA mismatch endonuclease, patch repair protein
MKVKMDTISQQRRSAVMGKIKGRNTKPEIAVRKLVHSMGYRYRLHRKDLPGTPDLVFPARNKIVFVHGCFWHRHPGCRFAYSPKSNIDFWNKKFAANIERDKRVKHQLESLGWKTLAVWECEVSKLSLLQKHIKGFLGRC